MIRAALIAIVFAATLASAWWFLRDDHVRGRDVIERAEPGP